MNVQELKKVITNLEQTGVISRADVIIIDEQFKKILTNNGVNLKEFTTTPTTLNVDHIISILKTEAHKHGKQKLPVAKVIELASKLQDRITTMEELQAIYPFNKDKVDILKESLVAIKDGRTVNVYAKAIEEGIRDYTDLLGDFLKESDKTLLNLIKAKLESVKTSYLSRLTFGDYNTTAKTKVYVDFVSELINRVHSTTDNELTLTAKDYKLLMSANNELTDEIHELLIKLFA
jgi:hypothetical protein